MRRAKVAPLLGADGIGNDVSGIHEGHAGAQSCSNGHPITHATCGPGLGAVDTGIPATVVAEIQAWLARKPASERGAECWQHLPDMLETAIARGIASVELQHADRDDLKQRIWLSIVRHFKDLDPAKDVESVIAWASTIAEREAKREAHRRKHRPRREETNQDEFLHSLVNENSDEDLDINQLRDLVREFVCELEGAGHGLVAQILALRYLDCLPHREVAARLGLRMKPYYGRHTRAIEGLRVRIARKTRSPRDS